MKKNKKIILISLCAVLALAALWLIHDHLREKTNSHQQPQVTQEQDNQKKGAVLDNTKGSSQGNYTAPNSSNNIELIPSQASESQVVLVTKLKGYSDGVCTLTTTNGGKNTTQSANVIYQPEFSTCAGFTIPVATLGTGNWTFHLSVYSHNITVIKEAALEVK